MNQVGEWNSGTEFRGYFRKSVGGILMMGRRSDKKTKSAPYVGMVVVEVVQDIRRYLKASSDDVAVRLIIWAAFQDYAVINKLAPFMWRDYVRGDTVWHGHANHENLDRLLPNAYQQQKRLSVRFNDDEIEELYDLEVALARGRAPMLAALLRLGIDSERVLQKAAPGYRFRSPYSLRKGVFQ